MQWAPKIESRAVGRKHFGRIILALLFLFLLVTVSDLSVLATDPSEAARAPSNAGSVGPIPEDYVHRPLAEFFTGLSCPSCMGGKEGKGPHHFMEEVWEEKGNVPEQPFTFVEFHELNGGNVDDLATDESKARMRHYQPGISGTPDVEFDGGYIKLGGLSTREITSTSAEKAVADSRQRYERNINPLHPLQSVRNKFKFVKLYVDQIFEGGTGEEGAKGKFAISVEAEYLGSNGIIPGTLRGSLYVFMVEDGVEAYSLVKERTVVNRNVFRGYAIEDKEFTLSRGETFRTTQTWTIPEAKIPIKPANVTAVAAVYDLDDTSSQEGNQGNNVEVPRCVQSATPASTAYDRKNDLPVIANIAANVNEKGGRIDVRADIDDSNGISAAYVFYNFKGGNATDWNWVEMNLSGEEICDDAGVCYAYADSSAVATIPQSSEDTLYYSIVAYDGSGLEYGGLGAGNRSEVARFSARGKVVGAEEGGVISLDTVGWILGGFFIIFLAALFLVRLKKRRGVGPGKQKGTSVFKGIYRNKKLFYTVIVLAVTVIIIASVYAVTTTGGKKAPDFTLTDIDGNEFSLSDFEGKVVVIDFMATWCSGCNEIMPDLVKVHEKYKDDIVMITVDIDQTENNKQLREFKEKHGAEWIFAMDTEDLLTRYNIDTIPKLVIIDGKGGVTFSEADVHSFEEMSTEIEKAKAGDSTLTSLGSTSLGLGGLAVVVGVGSFFSPCSFPMLPGYISYYIGIDKSKSVKKALLGGGAAALGLILVYLIIGIVVGLGGSAISPYIPMIEPFVGIVIIILGIVMLTSYTIPFHRVTEPIKDLFRRRSKENAGPGRFEKAKEHGYTKLFWYGMGYAGAAAGCTAPLLLAITLTALASGNLFSTLLIFLILAGVMAVLMIFITILIALSAGTLLAKLKISTVWIKRISGFVLIVVGIYLVVYYYVAFT